MLNKLLLCFTFLVALTALPARGADFNCRSRVGNDTYRFSVTGSGESLSSSAWLNGARMNLIGPCWIQTRPGTSHARCSHENAGGDRRLEVNVWSETTSGEIIRATAILWRDEEPEDLDLSGC